MSLKNGKSPGIDQVYGEMLKYGPEIIFTEIAEIFNLISETGIYPTEIKEGILIPLQKPGKKAGPSGNLRPIILLSTLRKILAICMLRRCLEKLLNKVPETQAAYQQGRSTTEQVFSFKILAEKAITSEDYRIILLMLDMSKAFDTVRRDKLFLILKDILDQDELHMMKILIENVKLKTRIGDTMGTEIKTNIGVPQGDCLSPILFIIYLAEALQPTFSITNPPHREDHNYCKNVNTNILIDQQYADDISWIANDVKEIQDLKREVPLILEDKNLIVNNTKTEEYEVVRGGDDKWKKCKYLGSLLETENDINRRKILATNAYNQLKYIFESKKTSREVKIRIFRSHIESIFLYNCELWTITKNHENTIDVFQRKLIRKMLNIKWQDKVSNNHLYKITKLTSWSIAVKRRRLNWYGHLLRLPEQAPANKALREAKKPCKKPRGGQKMTWMKLVEKDFENIKVNVIIKDSNENIRNLEIKDHKELANHRHVWNIVVDRAVSNKDGGA